MPKKPLEMPKFKNESDEADWWASAAGQAYVLRKSREARAKGIKFAGLSLVNELNKKNSTQIALRMPESDIKQARKLAAGKGMGYQTFLKMIIHEGLEREAQRS
jgi:CopG antitoxin of type II toxin-antitoxin system